MTEELLVYDCNLNIRSFIQMLDDTTECYKFYWLDSIMQILIPVKGDKLVLPSEAMVTVPFDLVDLYQEQLFEDTFDSSKQYVLLNDERAAGFTEYYSWLKTNLNVSVFTIEDWAKKTYGKFQKVIGKASFDQLAKCYEFLNDYKTSGYIKDSKFARKKSQYEDDVQLYVNKAWKVIRKTRMLINAENDYVSAFNNNDEEQIYLSSTSEYHKIAKSAIVLSLLSDKFKSLLEECFGIKEFDNFEYVKGKILVKYPLSPKKVDVTDSFVKEYANDIIQVSRLMQDASYRDELKELISERCIVLAKNKNNAVSLMKPREVYKEISVEGADMRSYYEDVKSDVAFLYYDFYREKGISTDNIYRLGIVTSPIDDGPKSSEGITAIGDFKPFLRFNHLQRNIDYIQNNPQKDLSKKKSAAILKIIFENAYKMSGSCVKGIGDNAKTTEGICSALNLLRKSNWLYVNGKIYSIEDVSKNQLDRNIYKDITLSRYGEQARILGFNIDEIDQAFDGVDNLDKSTKQELLKKLAKEFGVDISVKNHDHDDVFDPDDFDMNEFPARYISNMERLKRHIENQFFTADPVRYKEIIVRQKENESIYKQIRKSYLKGMYTNQFGKVICQGCCMC